MTLLSRKKFKRYLCTIFSTLCWLYLEERLACSWPHQMGHFSYGLVRYYPLSKYETPTELRDKLKRSERGRARDWASSLRSRLVIRSGPAVLPIGSNFTVSLTSLGVTIIESSLYVVFFTIWGRVAWLSSNRVCPVKKLFKVFALSFSSM